jgi:hypothetical protein
MHEVREKMAQAAPPPAVILEEIRILKKRIAEGKKKAEMAIAAEERAAALVRPARPHVTRESLLEDVASLSERIRSARAEAERVSDEVLRADVLTQAAKLRDKVENLKIVLEGALTEVQREFLRRQVAQLSAQVKRYMTSIRLMPGIIVP